MFVGVSNTPVVLFFVLVFDRIGRRIPPQPELLDELFAFFVGIHLLEGFALFIRDDVRDILVEPLLPGCLQLFLQCCWEWMRT